MGAVSGVDLLWGQGQEQVFGDGAHGPGFSSSAPRAQHQRGLPGGFVLASSQRGPGVVAEALPP